MERQAAWREVHAVPARSDAAAASAQPAAGSTADAAAHVVRVAPQAGSGSVLAAPAQHGSRVGGDLGSLVSSRPETVGNGGGTGEAPAQVDDKCDSLLDVLPQETVGNCVDLLSELAEFEAAAAASCMVAPNTHPGSSTPIHVDHCTPVRGEPVHEADDDMAEACYEEDDDGGFGYDNDMGPSAYI